MPAYENEPKSSLPVPRVSRTPRKTRTSIEGKALLAVAVLLVVISSVLLLGRSLFSTKILESDQFAGIKPLQKRTTSIIVVHGIGNHCIGYGDPLIANLMKELTGSSLEPIAQYYERYEKSVIRSAQTKEYGVRFVNGTYRGDFIDLPRDGHCNKIPLNEVAAAKGLSINVNTGDDLDTAVSAQDKLCAFINENNKAHRDNTQNVRATCHKLSVTRIQRYPLEPEEEREYITGFIRQFDKDISANSRVRLYEVTWSPATRWLKQSLSRVERFNSEMSGHWMNKFLKTEIMNTGIADAVAYLSESGILVNFNILQAFCLALANEKSSVTDYAFTCDAEQLGKSSESFSKHNDVVLVSHSLGTRVVLDSIGLLSLGVKGRKPDGPEDVDLVTAIGTKFRQIGAHTPDHYHKDGFRALLNNRIPEFARAIRSVYVFTNQVPLLAATVTSPFNETYQVGRGFQEFLELRGNGVAGTAPLPLQIVSFHDPDDLLSYNLSCWYHVAVLRNSELTLTRVEQEAQFRAKRDGTEVGIERRTLRDKLFNDNCSKRKFSDKGDIALFDAVQSNDLLVLKSATVRLKGLRVEALAASPLDVHSNYFRDSLVHRWIVNGNYEPRL